MAGDKSEKPTQQRVRKAREQGQFLSARSLISAVEFGVALTLLSSFSTSWFSKMRGVTINLLQTGMTAEMADAQWTKLIRDVLIEGLLPLVSFGGILLAVTGSANLGVTQFGFSVHKLMPDFKRLNPISRLKDLPSQNLKSVVEAVCLIGLLVASLNSFYQDNTDALLRLPFQSLPVATAMVASMLTGVLWKAAFLFFLFGGVDLFRQYRRHMGSMRMTKQEIKQEHRSNEGDPQTKGRIRRLRRDMMRGKMLKSVATATAVVVNPTHYAVAIKYDIDSMSSPVVVAKGKNWLALRIRTIAVQNEVPIVENPPLARALHGSIKVGQPIPPEFYRAMAEILAYIYKMMGHGTSA